MCPASFFNDDKWSIHKVDNYEKQLLDQKNIENLNLIQITLQHKAIIWDLDKQEEFDSLFKPNYFNGSDNFALTSFRVRADFDHQMVQRSSDRSLFLAQIPDQQNLDCFRLYSGSDLIFTLYHLKMCKQSEYFDKVCPRVLTANFRGQTFVSVSIKDNQDRLIETAAS